MSQIHYILFPQRFILPILTLQNHGAGGKGFGVVPAAEFNAEAHYVGIRRRNERFRQMAGIIIKVLPELSLPSDCKDYSDYYLSTLNSQH